MSNSSVGQQLLALVENDALTAFGPPLLAFLSAVEAAQGDKIKQAAAFVKLQGDAVAAAPAALGGLESQLAALLATKIQALIAKA